MKDHQTLKLRRLGIDTYTDPVLFMNGRCPVFRSEGFEARSRVRVTLGERSAKEVAVNVTRVR